MELLPDKVKVLHQVFDIFPTDQGDFSCLGECDVNSLKIKISERVALAKQLECLWHECAHVFEKTFQWFDDEEELELFCYRLGVIAMQVLRDNPKILELHASLIDKAE